jgi:TPR repeat protein
MDADAERAARLRKKACDDGDGSSCMVLGAAAIEAGDLSQGGALLEKACDSDGRACTRRGLVALQKQQDPQTAQTYFERGCTAEPKDPDGCGWMGWGVYSGLTDEADTQRGAALLTGACDAGSAAGCMFLAVTHARAEREDEAKVAIEKACGLQPAQCDALRAQYDKLSQSE